MKRLKIGEKILINGRVATVWSKPAPHKNGLQGIHYDGRDPFWGLEWRGCEDLKKFPRVEQIEAQP